LVDVDIFSPSVRVVGSFIESELQQAMEELAKRIDSTEQQIQALREYLNRRFDQLVEIVRKGVPPIANEESSKEADDRRQRMGGGSS
jgi:chaperonin cofactor prefoldin